MATRGAYWNNAGGQVSAPKLQSYGDAFKPMSNVVDRLASLQQRKMDLEDKQAFQAQREESRDAFQAEQKRFDREQQQGNADRTYNLAFERLNSDNAFRDKQLNLKGKELALKKEDYNFRRRQAKEKSAREKAAYATLGSLSDPTATKTVTDLRNIVKEETNGPAIVEKTKDDVKSINNIGKRLSEFYDRVDKKVLDIYKKDGEKGLATYVQDKINGAKDKYAEGENIFGRPKFKTISDRKKYDEARRKHTEQAFVVKEYLKLKKSADATANQIAAKANAVPTRKIYGKTEVIDNAQTAKNAESQIRQLIESGVASTKAGSYRVKQLQDVLKSSYKSQADIDKEKAKAEAEQTKAAVEEQKANRQAARDMAKTQWKDMDKDERAEYSGSFAKYLKKVIG
jgi:hypothetical protein